MLTVSQQGRVLREKEELCRETEEKLRVLIRHPRARELLKDIELGFWKKEEEMTAANILQRVRHKITPRFSGTVSVLLLTRDGLKERIIINRNYYLTTRGLDSIHGVTYRDGGTLSESERFVGEQEISRVVEEYDLKSAKIDSIISRLEQ